MDEGTIRALHLERVKRRAQRAVVDDATWEDLDMPRVLEALDATASPLGKLILYDWLRNPATTVAEFEAVRARLALGRRLEEAPGATAALARSLGKLPRLPGLLVEVVWGTGTARLPSLGVAPRVLAALALLAPAGFLLSANLGLGLVAAAFVINLGAHFWWGRWVWAGTASVDFLANALRCARALGAQPALGAAAEELRALSSRLAPLDRAAGEARTPAGVDDFAEYIRVYLLTRERRLTTCAALVQRHGPELRALFELLGTLDAATAASLYRRTQPSWCVPELEVGQPLVLEDLRHPLLGGGAVPSTLELGGGLLVTGSNMSGKSTFLRAVALNVLLAQSLGFSCCRAHRGPVLRVATSLRATDALTEGRSYYLAEAQRLGAILSTADPAVLVVVDEPFRGTNSAERVAASVAVLRHLRQLGALVVAATHDLEVTELLDGAYQQGHFEDGLDASGLHFDFRLRPGVATEHNAIRLLSQLGYPPSLLSEARALVGQAARATSDRVPSARAGPGAPGVRGLELTQEPARPHRAGASVAAAPGSGAEKHAASATIEATKPRR